MAVCDGVGVVGWQVDCLGWGSWSVGWLVGWQVDLCCRSMVIQNDGPKQSEI